MPEFKIQIGRDATVYKSATIEADSLEEAKDNLTKYDYTCPPDTVWAEDGYNSFDNVEVCIIESPNGDITTFDANDGWKPTQKKDQVK